MANNWAVPKILMLVFVLGVGHIVCDRPAYIETGKNYTFTPNVNGKIETILWKVQNNKLVEYEGVDEPHWYRFKHRGGLDIKTGVLTLQGLKKDESGSYEAEIQVDGNLQNTIFDVKVIDAVSVPRVTCEKNSEGEKTLHCSVDSTVDFQWTGPNSFKQSGQTVNISQKTGPNSIYFCIAKNNVSQQSVQFNLDDCEPGGVNVTAIIIGVLVAIVLLVVLICVYKKWDVIKEYKFKEVARTE